MGRPLYFKKSSTLSQEDCTRLTLLVRFSSVGRANFGDRAFSAAGPRVLNKLPTDLRQLDFVIQPFHAHCR